jgi:hypothetical protein
LQVWGTQIRRNFSILTVERVVLLGVTFRAQETLPRYFAAGFGSVTASIDYSSVGLYQKSKVDGSYSKNKNCSKFHEFSMILSFFLADYSFNFLSCVEVEEYEEALIDQYHCPTCSQQEGPSKSITYLFLLQFT